MAGSASISASIASVSGSQRVHEWALAPNRYLNNLIQIRRQDRCLRDD